MKWSHYIQCCAGAVCLGLASTGTQAGDLHGVVTRPPVESEKAPEIRRYRDIAPVSNETAAGGALCNPGLYAVISLIQDREATVAPQRDTLEMVQRGKTFQPAVLAVTVNSTVSFPNFDPFYHNVFSYSKPKPFDLGKYEQGKTKYVTFNKPGIVQVFCEIHYSMRAYIHVLETPYFAVSDDRGAFVIRDVPAGEYQVRVWQEGQSDLRSTVNVEGDSTWVELR